MGWYSRGPRREVAMRILTLNANLQGVGTYQRCFYFSRELARAGHDVTMATVARNSKYKARVYYRREWGQERHEPDGAGPWVRMIEGANLGYKWLPGWGSGPLDIVARTRELASGKYEVVYGFEYQPNVSWPVYCTRPFHGYRFLSDWCDWYAGHSNHLRGWKLAHRIDGFFEERIRRFASRVTVISKVLKERAIQIGIPEERVQEIPQGADTDYVKPQPAAEMRRELRLPLDAPIVVSVSDGDMGRIVRIFHLLAQRRNDVLGVVVGHSAGAHRLAKEFGLEQRIVWAGRVSDQDYPKYLSAADVILFPLQKSLLNQARFPGKLLDYFSAGRPVVSNDVGETGRLIREHNLGLLAGEQDREMADAIERLLDDDQLRRQAGERARELMVTRWRWELRGPQILAAVHHAA